MKARASASRRGRPPSNSAIPARSSKKARQSSPDQLSRPARRSAAPATDKGRWHCSRARDRPPVRPALRLRPHRQAQSAPANRHDHTAAAPRCRACSGLGDRGSHPAAAQMPPAQGRCRRLRFVRQPRGPRPSPPGGSYSSAPACSARSWLSRLSGEICVRTVRAAPTVGFQRVGADGWIGSSRSTVRMLGYRPQRRSREPIGGIASWRRRGLRGRCGRSHTIAFWRSVADRGDGRASLRRFHSSSDINWVSMTP